MRKSPSDRCIDIIGLIANIFEYAEKEPKTNLESAVRYMRQHILFNDANKHLIVTIIYAVVCKQYNITREEIENSKKRNDDLHYSRMFLYIFLTNLIPLTPYKVAQYLNISRVIVYRSNKEFEKLDPQKPKEKILLDIYNEMLSKINKVIYEYASKQINANNCNI